MPADSKLLEAKKKTAQTVHRSGNLKMLLSDRPLHRPPSRLLTTGKIAEKGNNFGITTCSLARCRGYRVMALGELSHPLQYDRDERVREGQRSKEPRNEA